MALDIASYIPFGRENAITRKQLRDITGLPDRAMRKLINIARLEGAIIINAQDGNGYYQSDDPEDIRRQYATNRRRALNILAQQKPLKRKLYEVVGQINIEDIFEEALTI